MSCCECNMDVEKKNCPLPQSALILLCFIGARNIVRVINIFVCHGVNVTWMLKKKLSTTSCQMETKVKQCQWFHVIISS